MEWFGSLDIDYNLILTHLVRIVISYLLALPIAYEREKAERTAGLSTFPLVAVGSCARAVSVISIVEKFTVGFV